MALFDLREPGYSPPRTVIADWDNFRKGLITFLKDIEIPRDSMSQADNILLIGKGTPTRRWGFGRYFTASPTGSVRGLSGYYNIADDLNELIAITDAGYLTIKSGLSYVQRSGVSWPSGYNISMTQLDKKVYIVGKGREMVRYASPTLTAFATVAPPTNVYATPISGASGTSRYSYRVTTITQSGDSLGTNSFLISNQGSNLATFPIKVSFTGASAASGVIEGYGIYGRNQGDERFITKVFYPETSFIDDGTITPAEFGYPPIADATGGIVCGNVEKYIDRLIYSDVVGDESKVVISGRVPLHERTDVASGGNYIRIEPDSGDPVIMCKGFGSRLIAFKERSLWDLRLEQITVGNFVVTQPSAVPITTSNGCIAPRSICAVEKDIFYLSPLGVYSVGYEPNILADILRSAEVSSSIRPYFETLTQDQLRNAFAIYSGFKYILIFPGKNEAMVYDRERTCWIGPWTFDAQSATIYYDSTNTKRVLLGSDDSPDVFELSQSYPTDNGEAIQMIIRTRKEDFGDWSIFKTLKDVYANWKNVQGEIFLDIRIEDRNGVTKTIKTITITESEALGESGWGWDIFGTALFGDTSGTGSVSAINDLVKWISVNKTVRRVQFIIRSSGTGSNFELLGIQSHVRPIGRGLKGKGWRATS